MNAFTKLPQDNVTSLLGSTRSTGTTADALLLSRRSDRSSTCHTGDDDDHKKNPTTNQSQRRSPSIVRRRHRHRRLQDQSITLLNRNDNASSSSLMDALDQQQQQQTQQPAQAPLRNRRVRKGTPTTSQSLFFFLDVIDEIPNDDSDVENSDENNDNHDRPLSKRTGPATVSTGSLMRMEDSSLAGHTQLSSSLASPLMRRAKQACACLVVEENDDDNVNDDHIPKEWRRAGRRRTLSSIQHNQSHKDHPHGVLGLVVAMDKRNDNDDWGFFEEHGENVEE